MSVSVRRDVVILACAISAGIHGALAPDHFREGAAAGGGFAAATVMLALLGVALTRRPEAAVLYAGAALTLGGLIASYAFAVTTGLPLLDPEREAVDGLALVTEAIEVVGLAASLSLLERRRPVLLSGRATHLQTKGTPA